MAHIHGRPDDERQWFEDLLGRGDGDPDIYGYPGQDIKPKMSHESKQELTRQALSEGYTEDEIESMVDAAEDIFGGLL